MAGDNAFDLLAFPAIAREHSSRYHDLIGTDQSAFQKFDRQLIPS
ncbi:hypothetical protein [Bradyrhizobium sp. 186]|nr:hypothetical protein [Bradyrhizobium sp. 186]